jgi:hypothetical protein
MKQKHRPFHLGLTLLVLAGCYLAVCGVSACLLGRANRREPEQSVSTSGSSPTSTLPLVQGPPQAQEAQTARTLALATLPPRDLADLASRLQENRDLVGVRELPEPAETPAVSDYVRGNRKTF